MIKSVFSLCQRRLNFVFRTENENKRKKNRTVKNKEYIICMCGTGAAVAAAASHIRIPKTCYNIFLETNHIFVPFSLRSSNHAYTPKIYFSFHLLYTHSFPPYFSRSLFLDLFYFVRNFFFIIIFLVLL